MINKKVVFCIPVRNESSNLKSLFKTLDKLNLKFEDYFIIFVESDSSDNSSDLIKKYLERRKGVLINKNYGILRISEGGVEKPRIYHNSVKKI